MLGAEGASGSPFFDDEGRVVGVLQLGLGAKEILGQRTAGVLEGLDLVRWWGPRDRLDLCRAYPKGGIAGCPDSTPPPPPPPPPPAYHVSGCWTQFTAGPLSTADPSAAVTTLSAADIVTRQAANFGTVIQLTAGATTAIAGIRESLLEPNGTVFSSFTFSPDWAAGDSFEWVNLQWTWQDGLLFFQHPELTGTAPQTWTFKFDFPDGESCSNPVVVTD
jgi:hypothetical protein